MLILEKLILGICLMMKRWGYQREGFIFRKGIVARDGPYDDVRLLI